MEKEKNKTLGIVFGVLFYLLVPVFFLIFYLMACLGFSEEIWFYSRKLFDICHLYIPIILMILPLILKFFLKKEFYKSILYTLLIITIYVPMVFLLKYGIVAYMKNFTISKWNNYSNLRYLMVESFEQKYSIVGRKKEEIYDLLGKPASGVLAYDSPNSFCYEKGYSLFDVEYYCFIYDDHNIIIKTT